MYYGLPCTFLLLFIPIMYFLMSFSSTIMYYIVLLILNISSSLKKNGGTSKETSRVSAVWQQKIPHT